MVTTETQRMPAYWKLSAFKIQVFGGPELRIAVHLNNIAVSGSEYNRYRYYLYLKLIFCFHFKVTVK